MDRPAPECVFIAMTTASGGLEVMQFVSREAVPSGDGFAWIDRDTSDEAINHEISRRPPDSAEIVSWRRIEEEHYRAMGKDRDFRAAWSDDGKSLHVPLDKARACARDRLRSERAPMLAKLDADYMRAMEAGEQAKMAEIAAEKDRLRDITQHPAIDAAKSLDDLRAVSIEAGT